MSRLVLIPPVILAGENALTDSKRYIKGLGRKALIVTDETMRKVGNVAKVQQMLDCNEIDYAVFDRVNGEPTDKMVDSGVKVYKAEKCDFLIGLGGGSPIDTAKAIGAVVSGGGNIDEYYGREITAATPPFVAVPTTAGTGSEATQFTIITNTQNNVKMLLKGQTLISDVAVIDPQFTITAPPRVTSATGLDALTHAIEAYTSKKAQPMSDTFALSAVKRIFTYLPAAYTNGDDLVSRTQMSIAALEAGIAFNNASVTLVHGMSRPIGALFHVPHGMSNAMLLPECLEYALPGAPERFRDLGEAAGVCGGNEDALTAGRAFVDAVEGLCSQLNVEPIGSYTDKNTYFGSLDKMAIDALASGSPENTIRPIGKDSVIAIYRKIWRE